MDLVKIIGELRAERKRLEQLIRRLERAAQAPNKKAARGLAPRKRSDAPAAVSRV